MSFPTTGQLANEFFIDPRDLPMGARYAPDFNNDVVPTALIAAVDEVGQIDTVTVTYGADGDVFGFVYDGATIQAAAITDSDLSTVNLEVAANAAIMGALAGQIASVSLAANVLTVTSVAGSGSHTLADFEPDTTTVALANTQVAVTGGLVHFGMGVVQDTTAPDLIQPGSSAVREPRGSADDGKLWGVIAQQQVNNYDASQLALLGQNPTRLASAPAAYQAVKRGRIIVPWVGALPGAKGSQEFFWINNAGAATSGAFQTAGDVTTDPATYHTAVEVERIITRPMGSFSGFVGLNFKTAV